MTRRAIAPEIAHLVDAPLGKEQFLQRIRQPLTSAELEEVLTLTRWFTRRYPTVKARLDYARRRYERWNRRLPEVNRSAG